MQGSFRTFVFGAAAVCAGLLASGFAPAVAQDGRVIYAPGNDPQLAAAKRKAQAGLRKFLATAANPPAGAEDFAVKFPVRDGDVVEHFWLNYRGQDKGHVIGVIANRPQNVGNVRYGQEMRVPFARISDWNYLQDGRRVGAWSVCVFAKRMPRAQASEFLAGFRLTCN